MAIEITGNRLSFDGQDFDKGDVTASKDIETKRKSSDGIPIKRLRSFESASTFIDLDETNRTKGDRIKIKVATSFEALDISTKKISLGPKETVPLELTGALDIRPANNKPHKFHGMYQISGKHAGGNSLPIADNDVVSFSVTGSNVYSGSSYVANFASMSMDISQGGFFGLAVQGSTHASNLANLADFLIDFNQSGSTTFEGGDTTVSQSADDTLIVSGGNANYETDVNVDVTNPSSSFDVSGSDGSVTFEVSGGNTNFNTNVNVDVTDPTSSFDVSGSGDTVTFEVSGGNTNFNTNVNVDVTDPTSSFDVSGSGDTVTFEVSGGNTNFNTNVNVDVTDPTSSFDISGSDGSVTFEVSGGNTNINSEFTQSGASLLEGGTTTIAGDMTTTESIASGSDIAVEVSGTLNASNVVINASNMIPVTSSQTLTFTGQKPYYVKSGSSPVYNAAHAYAGLPMGVGYKTVGADAGTVTLTLPLAQIGMQFTFKNLMKYHIRDIGDTQLLNVPSLKIKPNSNDRFYTGPTGSFAMSNGQGIVNHSGSAEEGDEAMIWSPSGSRWMIGSLIGTWTDEN